MYQIVLTIQVLFGYVTISQTLSTVPETSFSCEGRIAGYYADPETGCQSYHMCDSRARKYSYLCPNLTLFHQKFLVCDHWNSVECGKSEDYYFLNEEIAGLRVQDVNDVDNVKQAQLHQEKNSVNKESQSRKPLREDVSADLSLPGIRVENTVKTDILDQVVGPKLFSPISVSSNSFSLIHKPDDIKTTLARTFSTTERTSPGDNLTSFFATTTVTSRTPATLPSKLTTTEKRKNTNRAFFTFTKASPISITQSAKLDTPTPDPIKSVGSNLTVPPTRLGAFSTEIPINPSGFETKSPSTISDEDFTTNLPLVTLSPVKVNEMHGSPPEKNVSNVDFINLSDGSFLFQFPGQESPDVEILGPNQDDISQSVSEDLHEKAHTSDFYSLLGMKNFFHSTLDQLSWILPQSRSKQPRLTVVFNRPNSAPQSPVQKPKEQDHKDPSGKHIKQDNIKHKATMKFQLKTKSSLKNAHCPECHPSFIVSDCFPCISIR